MKKILRHNAMRLIGWLADVGSIVIECLSTVIVTIWLAIVLLSAVAGIALGFVVLFPVALVVYGLRSLTGDNP